MAEPETTQNVVVAVKIRPLVAAEVEQGCRASLSVIPGAQPQISTGQHTFTYDCVFGEGAQDSSLLYPHCVSPLVEGLFKGYNATVFAYGQTGSGKTWTMGSEYRPGSAVRSNTGVIPEAINAIFNRIATLKDWQASVRVSFVEIHKEEVRDLLITGSGPRAAVSIREVPGGGVSLAGAVEKEVKSLDEMVAVLEMGTLCRATASTNMNNRSSRSHAIFTITLEQRRVVTAPSTPGAAAPGSASATAGNRTGGEDEDDDVEEGAGGAGEGELALDDFLAAKMHLVDLAGSERAKRTKAEGARLKEGIHINRGLLALGNVINAIVDNHKHVPYRDSKLTRLLQDSLGGNSRTVMIACVSPADINYEESLNTLRYADRARHIRNKPVINRDPVAAEVAALRQQLATLRGENMALRRALAADGKDQLEDGMLLLPSALGLGGGGGATALAEALQSENSSLELENTRLRMQMDDLRAELSIITDRCCGLQAQLDLLQATQAAASAGAITSDGLPHTPAPGQGASSTAAAASVVDGLLKGYVSRIAELERELRAARQFQGLRRRTTTPSVPGGAPAAAAGSHGGDACHVPATPLAPGLITPAPMGSTLMSSPRGADIAQEPSYSGAPGAAGPGLHHLEGVAEEEELGLEEEYPGDEDFYAEMAQHALEQEKMKQEMAALQRALEVKEKKMAELMAGTGQVPALKQHYDRVLADLQRERDALVNEKNVILQKLAHITAASEEERKRIEAVYKDRLAAADEKLKALRHKEREFVQMQKLKHQTEEMCKRLSGDITRLKAQKVAVQRNLEASAKQHAQWRLDREKELVQLRRQNRQKTATIQAMQAMQAKKDAVLQRKIADANAARKKLRELQAMSKGSSAAAGSGSSASSDSNGPNPLARTISSGMASGAGRVNHGSINALEVQPNPDAPLLRTEKQRREWIDLQLDHCNLSSEYRKVLEGELAQRAETNRQLREVVKRLMLTNNLVPASPLHSGPAAAALDMPSSSMTPISASGGDAEVMRGKLMERKAQLEESLREHNQQIAELQVAWERSKVEEEQKGGGAADARRWTGVKSIVEARDLLRTVFRAACDQRVMSNDLQLECVKLGEEVELLRVQLDAARKEAEAQRKRAAAIEVTAANAMATPFAGDAGAVAHTAADETVREVDALLQKLQAAKTPSSIVPQEAEVEEEALLNGEGYVRLSVSPGPRPVPERMDVRFDKVARELEHDHDQEEGPAALTAQAGSTPGRRAGKQGGRYTQTTTLSNAGAAEEEDVVPDDAELRRRYVHLLPEDNDTVVGVGAEDDFDPMDEDQQEEEEEEESSDDDEADMDWDPTNPTPARPSRASRRSSAAAAGLGSTGVDASGAATRRTRGSTSSRLSAVAWPVDGTANGMGGGAGGNGGGASRRSSLATGPANGRRRSGSAQPSSLAALSEAPVLEKINLARTDAGLDPVTRLTVKVLKEALAGRVMPDGKVWRAGSKTRDQLLADYSLLVGLPVPGSSNPSTTSQRLMPGSDMPPVPHPINSLGTSTHSLALGSTRDSAAVLMDTMMMASTSSFAAAAPSISGADSPTLQLGSRAASGASMGHGDGPVAAGTAGAGANAAASGALNSPRLLAASSLDYKAAVLLPASPSAAHRQQHPSSPSAAGLTASRQGLSPRLGGSGWHPAAPPRTPLLGASNMGSSFAGSLTGGRSSPRMSTSQVSTGADSTGKDVRELTPLSRLYIQQAEEARKRTAIMRQSMSKANAASPSAASLMRASQALPPSFSLANAASLGTALGTPTGSGAGVLGSLRASTMLGGGASTLAGAASVPTALSPRPGSGNGRLMESTAAAGGARRSPRGIPLPTGSAAASPRGSGEGGAGAGRMSSPSPRGLASLTSPSRIAAIQASAASSLVGAAAAAGGAAGHGGRSPGRLQSPSNSARSRGVWR